MADCPNYEILLDALAEAAYETAGPACPPTMSQDEPCILTDAEDEFDVANDGILVLPRAEGVAICRRCWVDYLARPTATSGR